MLLLQKKIVFRSYYSFSFGCQKETEEYSPYYWIQIYKQEELWEWVIHILIFIIILVLVGYKNSMLSK